jgi:hypothetical protein
LQIILLIENCLGPRNNEVLKVKDKKKFRLLPSSWLQFITEAYRSTEVYNFRPLFWPVSNHRDDHLFQRDAPVLEGLVIKVHKLVVVVGVHKVVINLGKYKAAAYVQFGQHGIVRVFYVEHILGIKIQIFPLFVTQVGVGIPIADDLAWGFSL